MGPARGCRPSGSDRPFEGPANRATFDQIFLKSRPEVWGAAQSRALDVIDSVVAGQPPRDMVAGGAILGEPIIAKVEKSRLL